MTVISSSTPDDIAERMTRGASAMQDQELKDMLIEYMGKGFLDNIIALFRQDASVYRFIPDMLAQENLQVRLGTVALVEELATQHKDDLRQAVPGLISLLRHENPTIRGDAAGLLGTIRDASAIPALESAAQDPHAGVRDAASEALQEIK